MANSFVLFAFLTKIWQEMLGVLGGYQLGSCLDSPKAIFVNYGRGLTPVSGRKMRPIDDAIRC